MWLEQELKSDKMNFLFLLKIKIFLFLYKKTILILKFSYIIEINIIVLILNLLKRGKKTKNLVLIVGKCFTFFNCKNIYQLEIIFILKF